MSKIIAGWRAMESVFVALHELILRDQGSNLKTTGDGKYRKFEIPTHFGMTGQLAP